MNRSSSWLTVLPSLIIPACLGLMMYLGMSAMLERDVISNVTVVRYLTGHPVSTATLILFFVGIGSLLMIAANVFGQWGAAKRIRLQDYSPNSAGDDSADDNSADRVHITEVDLAVELGHQLLKMPKRFREHYLWQRLHESLHFVHRTGATKSLEDETKYLSEMDLDQQHQRYSLVRILIWATPMLGFLGTVLGISQALGGINVGPENDFQEMMGGLRSSLYVAFDTTALALVLSMVLMFGQFLVDRFESQLLKFVDFRTRQELSSHFNVATSSEQIAVEKMGLSVLETTEEMIKRQTEIWQKSIVAAEKAWEDSITGVNEMVRVNLTTALEESVGKMSAAIGTTIQKADDSMAHRWQQWQVTLSDCSRSIKVQQNELTNQTKMVQKLVDSITLNLANKKTKSADLAETDTTNRAAAPVAKEAEPANTANVESVDRATVAGESLNIVFSTFDDQDATESTDAFDAVEPNKQDIVPEVIVQPTSEMPILKIFDSNEDTYIPVAPETVEAVSPSDVPRYLHAEQRAGFDPVVAFPVQIDAKKAA